MSPLAKVPISASARPRTGSDPPDSSAVIWPAHARTCKRAGRVCARARRRALDAAPLPLARGLPVGAPPARQITSPRREQLDGFFSAPLAEMGTQMEAGTQVRPYGTRCPPAARPDVRASAADVAPERPKRFAICRWARRRWWAKLKSSREKSTGAEPGRRCGPTGDHESAANKHGLARALHLFAH